MTITEAASGTVTADGTEQTINTQAAAGTYLLVVDLSNMTIGDTVTVRVKDKVLSAGSHILAFEQEFSGDESPDWACFEPVAVAHSITFTLEQTAGTNRTFDWSVRSVS